MKEEEEQLRAALVITAQVCCQGSYALEELHATLRGR